MVRVVVDVYSDTNSGCDYHCPVKITRSIIIDGLHDTYRLEIGNSSIANIGWQAITHAITHD